MRPRQTKQPPAFSDPQRQSVRAHAEYQGAAAPMPTGEYPVTLAALVLRVEALEAEVRRLNGLVTALCVVEQGRWERVADTFRPREIGPHTPVE